MKLIFLGLIVMLFSMTSAIAQTTVNLATVSSSGTGYTWASPVLTVNNGANLIITGTVSVSVPKKANGYFV